MTRRTIFAALAAAAILAVVATGASGFVPTATKLESECSCNPYHEYGWPWQWRTDAPPEVLHQYHGSYTFGEHSGTSDYTFFIDSVAWFLILAPPALAIALIARLRGPRITRPHRPAALP